GSTPCARMDVPALSLNEGPKGQDTRKDGGIAEPVRDLSGIVYEMHGLVDGFPLQTRIREAFVVEKRERKQGCEPGPFRLRIIGEATKARRNMLTASFARTPCVSGVVRDAKANPRRDAARKIPASARRLNEAASNRRGSRRRRHPGSPRTVLVSHGGTAARAAGATAAGEHRRPETRPDRRLDRRADETDDARAAESGRRP